MKKHIVLIITLSSIMSNLIHGMQEVELHSAVASGNFEKITNLFKQVPLDEDQKGGLLLNAIGYKTAQQYNIIEWLAEQKGVDVNWHASEGATSLHVAAYWLVKTKIVQLLLDKGAKPNARDRKNNTPLHFLIANRSHKKRVLKQARMLLDGNADINKRNCKGQTPLHCARSVWAIQFLMDNKADIRARDNEGNTPVDLAAQEIDPFSLTPWIKQVAIEKSELNKLIDMTNNKEKELQNKLEEKEK